MSVIQRLQDKFANVANYLKDPTIDPAEKFSMIGATVGGVTGTIASVTLYGVIPESHQLGVMLGTTAGGFLGFIAAGPLLEDARDLSDAIKTVVATPAAGAGAGAIIGATGSLGLGAFAGAAAGWIIGALSGAAYDLARDIFPSRSGPEL